MENEITLTTLDQKVDIVIRRTADQFRFFVRPFSGIFTIRNTKNFDNASEVIRHLDSRGYSYAAEMIEKGLEVLS